MLSWCLEAASGFYLSLLQEICTAFDLDLSCRRYVNHFNISFGIEGFILLSRLKLLCLFAGEIQCMALVTAIMLPQTGSYSPILHHVPTFVSIV